MTDGLAGAFEAVVDTVARARREPPDRLAGRLDADLMTELGFDSIELLGLWAELEERYMLAEGELAVSQAVTIRAIAQVLGGPAPAHAPAPAPATT